MTRIAWHEQEPGHFETDLVHHSGPSASGEFVCTLQLIDVATGWSERVAVLGRSYIVLAVSGGSAYVSVQRVYHIKAFFAGIWGLEDFFYGFLSPNLLIPA